MIKAIVTDIEGTTSSISFVKDVLFPYARQHMAAFVRDKQHDPAVKKLLDDVRQTVNQPDLSVDGVIQHLVAWIDQDKKVTPLKALQGLIWEKGYADGDFHGHMYDDAVTNLRRWQQQGLKLYVYSSGSIYAQKLLFGHTAFGDLTPLFAGYFDTTTGAKGDTTSYQKIAQAIGLPAAQILFLSDIPAELDAAKQAGMQTTQLVRDAQCQRAAGHSQVADFSAIPQN